MTIETRPITRRSFAALLGASGLGLSLGRRVVAEQFSESSLIVAASDPVGDSDITTLSRDGRERWTAAENDPWAWFERESRFDGEWALSGITTPLNWVTGERLTEVPGYLEDRLVPAEIRLGSRTYTAQGIGSGEFDSHPNGNTNGHPSPERQARDGRPPSEWLLSMDSEELREWLSTVEVPEAGVHGMTFWTHLTRDHFFRPLLVKGLTEVEQAKLHAAAHFGY